MLFREDESKYMHTNRKRERINERVSNKNAAMQSYNLKTVPAVNLKNSRKEVVKNL